MPNINVTVAQVVAAASDVLEAFHADLKQMLADERTPEREKQFLQSQLNMMPSAFFLLGAAAGHDSKKRRRQEDSQ
jgi:hypothetical protein